MNKGGKTYFASDFHLGSGSQTSSGEREQRIVSWLDSIENDAKALYLMGDIFDYWFEYGEVVPRGFVLLLGKIKQMTLKGIPVFFFTGNHDMWASGYLEKETGMTLYKKPVVKEIDGKKFFLAHGDGLGGVPLGDKIMKAAFSNKILQWLFARIHPNTGIKIMKFFSNLSRNSHSGEYEKFSGEEEHLTRFARQYLKKDNTIDYFIFGHRHIPVQYTLSGSKATLVFLGDWIKHFTYGVFDGNQFKLEKYEY